ncbi:MAG: hypothetical protein IJO93_01375 [Clostridia bacterium]|nr:hypothetical protein [Clostridia bacterium]
MSKKELFDIVTTHGSIVLGIVFLVLVRLDMINPAMNFVSSSEGQFLLTIFCIFALITSVKNAAGIHKQRLKNWKEKNRKP